MKRRHMEEIPLADEVTHLLEECRMILPGIQALFGFQLIAVLQPPFFEKLTMGEQVLHILALALVAISGAVVMTPAAYHRQTAPHEASEGFVVLASWLLLIAMAPLLLGITLDFYLVASIVLQNRALSIVLAIILGLIFVGAWYVLPHIGALRRLTGREH